MLFCRHIDLRIPVGYIGLEQQQDFGRCPHSCIGDGWASRQWRKLDKYMIEATETGHTPQKSPRSTTYTAEPHRGSNARKMGNKLILGSSGDRRRWTKDGRGTGDTTHSRSMVFLLSIGSIFKSGPERIRQPFPRGKGRHRKRLFPAETPPGPEVGISQRALTLLPDEKELNSQPPVVVQLTIENAFAGVFEKFVEAFPKKFGLVLFDLNDINPHPLVKVRQVAEVFPKNRIRLQLLQNIGIDGKSGFAHIRQDGPTCISHQPQPFHAATSFFVQFRPIAARFPRTKFLRCHLLEDLLGCAVNPTKTQSLHHSINIPEGIVINRTSPLDITQYSFSLSCFS